MAVLHKQIYRHSCFGGGLVNTTLCGRKQVETSPDGYQNVAEEDNEITCKFCLKILNTINKERETK